MNKDEPAFASKAFSDKFSKQYGSAGLTKREYYAGLALAALISPGSELYNPEVIEIRAKLAVEHADALIERLG